MQMVHTMCGQDTVNQFFSKLATSNESPFTNLKALIVPDGDFSAKMPLAAYLLSTYVLIDTADAMEDTEYATWFIDVLNTIYGNKHPDVPENNPVWNIVFDRFPELPSIFATIGLFVTQFDPGHIASNLAKIVPQKSSYFTPGMTENTEKLAKQAAINSRVAAMSSVANICYKAFVKNEHVPDPETITAILADLSATSVTDIKTPAWFQTDEPENIEPAINVEPKVEDEPPRADASEPHDTPSTSSSTVGSVPQNQLPGTTASKPSEPAKPVSTIPKPARVPPPRVAPAPASQPSEQPKNDAMASVVTGTKMAEPVPTSPDKSKDDKDMTIPQEKTISDDEIGEVVASGNESSPPTENDAAQNDNDVLANETIISSEDNQSPTTPQISGKHVTVPQKVLMELFAHAGTKDQIAEAVHIIEQDIIQNTPNAQFLVRFVPGVTQDVIKDILENRTTSGKYVNRQLGKPGDGIPHTNLSGGSTYTAGTKGRTLGPVEVPAGFTPENSSVLWDEPVITTMGFPFINFGAPEITTILKDKDESKVKRAYKKLKRQMKKIGLESPIKVLKDFKHAKGERCALNRITIDAEELLDRGNIDVMASVYPRSAPAIQGSIGTVSLTRDFIVEMYNVLSPTKGARIYMDILGMSEDEYADTLERNHRPPFYIFIPKERVAFKKAPAGFIARLFTSDKKPTLVEAKIGTHLGGFVMPFKLTRILFTEV